MSRTYALNKNSSSNNNNNNNKDTGTILYRGFLRVTKTTGIPNGESQG